MSDPVAPVSVEMVIKLDNGHVIVVELNTVRVYDISATIQREPDPDDPIGVPILGRFPTTPRWTVGAGGPGTVTVYEGVLEYESVTGNMRLGLIDEVERLKAMVDQFHEDWADLQLASQHGNPPGGWSDPERIAEFQQRLVDAEARHRHYVEARRQSR